MDKTRSVNALPLGNRITHSRYYDPAQLFPVKRAQGRDSINIKAPLPFHGEDLWTAYELSWLNRKGKPVVAMGEITFPCTAPFLVESKSLKLYLNSFNQSRFESAGKVKEIMEKDLSHAAGAGVSVEIYLPQRFDALDVTAPKGLCIDDLDIEITDYEVNPSLLTAGKGQVNETLYSNLLRTNCPVTEQPDWATVVIEYLGRPINREALLAYLVSFREHTGFHENCVEKIFMDLMARCTPEFLTVYARFTRRGGIDINPYRSTQAVTAGRHRQARQ
ncbi:MAG: NADPH-dependent 7-cyano-7-deazaguanine reductase QueF [Desulfobacterales bacterium]|nr:NADPH-dependent 7-cyano-7-deazaguanine reductase QueF [Desulfobacterales bacterium]